jgi:hypothetical protein
MPDDIPAQPLLVEIAIEPKSKADQVCLAKSVRAGTSRAVAGRRRSTRAAEHVRSSGLRCQPLAASYCRDNWSLACFGVTLS